MGGSDREVLIVSSVRDSVPGALEFDQRFWSGWCRRGLNLGFVFVKSDSTEKAFFEMMELLGWVLMGIGKLFFVIHSKALGFSFVSMVPLSWVA